MIIRHRTGQERTPHHRVGDLERIAASKGLDYSKELRVSKPVLQALFDLYISKSIDDNLLAGCQERYRSPWKIDLED